MFEFPPGVRFRSDKIQIQWWVKGRSFTATLDLPQTDHGIQEAVRIRKDRLRQTKKNGNWARLELLPTGNFHRPEDAYAEMFKRARRRGDYSLSKEQEDEIVNTAGGRCALTGVLFTTDRYGCQKAPYAPSLDRIDCSRGYHRDNVRLICVAANFAMNEWGEDILHVIATGYVSTTIFGVVPHEKRTQLTESA